MTTGTKTQMKAKFQVGEAVVLYKKGIVESVDISSGKPRYNVRYPDADGQIGLGRGQGYAVIDEDCLEEAT